MEKHTLFSYEIYKKLGFIEAELEIVRWHHERVALSAIRHLDTFSGFYLSEKFGNIWKNMSNQLSA